MGRNSELSESEKGQIIAYSKDGFSNRSIGAKINRSAHVVRNFLKDPENYGCNWNWRSSLAMDRFKSNPQHTTPKKCAPQADS